jgi:hypothetical protein
LNYQSGIYKIQKNSRTKNKTTITVSRRNIQSGKDKNGAVSAGLKSCFELGRMGTVFSQEEIKTGQYPQELELLPTAKSGRCRQSCGTGSRMFKIRTRCRT